MAQVVDASIAVAWCARGQSDAFTEAVLRSIVADGGHVPAQFLFEVMHSLTRLERRKLVTRPDIDDFVLDIRLLPLTIHRAYEAAEMANLYGLARRYGLKIYDASYLELALRTGLPLATRDAALARASEKAGAALFTA